ncbi:PREDICTED: cyclic AMP-dependent transcription factor ATF-1 [Nanorana parkeri]|uniref:cyclic AMP-dependent transcription factor ATF-1 n=1 Tax=Nanorana parkeri TaxID=125878 RepID=UPI0008549184|nr:PREDICTED: cyclic AMP-dependent transcription factor ATF-1 [Nanorana parkeri]
MEEVSRKSNSSTETVHTISFPATFQAAQLAQQMSLRGTAPMTLVLPGDQQVQVQGVIQSAQSSVIHSPQVAPSTASSISESEDSQDSSDSIDAPRKARILSRRISYGQILKDLSSEDTGDREREDGAGASIEPMSAATTIYQTSTGQYVTIAPNGTLQLATATADGVQGLQALAMSNAASNQSGTTILQYAQTSDGQQILVPSNQVVVQTASGDMQTYQIRTTSTTTSLPQTVVMTSPVTLSCQTQKSDDPQLKREIRLMKNREAARECRRKKKEYVKCLENRVAVLENQNKTLIEELKTLKDLYCHKTV